MKKRILIAICIIFIFMGGLVAESFSEIAAVKLISVGPKKAVVKYKGQKITVRKYYPDRPLTLSTNDMSYLQPCIGLQVIATIDRGEILSLKCGDSNPVLVVPDEFVK
jgi:hypothetical protein